MICLSQKNTTFVKFSNQQLLSRCFVFYGSQCGMVLQKTHNNHQMGNTTKVKGKHFPVNCNR
jgi:hypothetical protein